MSRISAISKGVYLFLVQRATSRSPACRSAPRDATAAAMARPLSPDDPILSAVVPVRNEEANITPLVAEIETTLKGSVYEIVHVDDDGTPDRLRAGIVDLPGVFWRQRRWRRPEVEERGP